VSQVDPGTTEVVAPDELPGADAELVVGALPDGWTYRDQNHPHTAGGNPTVIKNYVGPAMNFATPGGGQARQGLAVTAAWQPGEHQSGRWANPRTLVSPQVSQVAGFIDARDVQVASRPAVLFTRKTVPDAMRNSLPADVQAHMEMDDYTVMFAIGDWLIQLNGTGVDADTLLAIAQNVDVR
jgi:hypothetical protein